MRTQGVITQLMIVDPSAGMTNPLRNSTQNYMKITSGRAVSPIQIEKAGDERSEAAATPGRLRKSQPGHVERDDHPVVGRPDTCMLALAKAFACHIHVTTCSPLSCLLAVLGRARGGARSRRGATDGYGYGSGSGVDRHRTDGRFANRHADGD